MTKDEALKLALEALELNNSEWKDLADSGDSGYWKAEDQGHYQLTIEAITAIEEALAQPEQEPLFKKIIDKHPGLAEELKALDEQELVDWRNAAIRVGEDLSSVGPDGYYDMTAQEWLDWAIEQEPRGKNSLAQPEQEPVIDKSAAKRIATALGWTPQRKPLTQDGTMEIANQTAGQYWMDEAHIQRFRAAVEAAHGIKD